MRLIEPSVFCPLRDKKSSHPTSGAPKRFLTWSRFGLEFASLFLTNPSAQCSKQKVFAKAPKPPASTGSEALLGRAQRLNKVCSYEHRIFIRLADDALLPHSAELNRSPRCLRLLVQWWKSFAISNQYKPNSPFSNRVALLKRGSCNVCMYAFGPLKPDSSHRKTELFCSRPTSRSYQVALAWKGFL